MTKISNIKLTDFALRHFDSKFGGTKILNLEPKEFEDIVNEDLGYFNNSIDPNGEHEYIVDVIDGYAPFCKLMPVKNFTDAKVGSMPISISNHQYIRHGYSRRRDGEFDVFSRWLELPVPAPKANCLMLVLYSAEQINEEAKAEYEKKKAEGGIESIGLDLPKPFSGDWGIVAILGQNDFKEEPMKPETFDRNYMPIEFGGSGLKYPIIPKEPDLKNFEPGEEGSYQMAMQEYKQKLFKYNSEMNDIRERRKKCVDFWNKHVTVK